MRLSGRAADTAILSTILFPIFSVAVGNIDCTRVVVNKIPFNLKELGGARSVVHSVDLGPSHTNTTYTIDICKPLGKAKDVKKDDQCPHGTRVCAIEHQISDEDGDDVLGRVYPIAGELHENKGNYMNAKWELLKNSKSNDDPTEEGLLLVMNGGYKLEDGKSRPQKAVVKFLCDKSRTGLENLPKPENPYEEGKDKREEGGEEEDDGSPSLQFVSYTEANDADVLELKWKTKYACEDANPVVEHWGFFTWFLIIAFMSTAAYLIFGSWLNYNRYGARGWDLLPHGDTIRDLPYLLKDWFRRVLNTVQGGGSRGGYAAV